MTEPVLIAVAGHTNHGKTSLVRTLAWTSDFGEVADRRAVTRRVEWIDIVDDRGEPLVRLIDTPGLEDSIALRDTIESMRSDPREEGHDLLLRFLTDPARSARFPQPVKALAEVVRAHLVLNVIDVRQPVLAKYRDELEILRMANPRLINVLNFTARSSAQTEAWRDMLTRSAFGYVASFDVVALRPADETHLIDTIHRLLAQSPHEAKIMRFAALRRAQWQQFTSAALTEIADMLIDVAATTTILPRAATADAVQTAIESMQHQVRERERETFQRIVRWRGMMDEADPRRTLLALPTDGWQVDAFDRHALVRLAKIGGGGVAAGAAAGVLIDLAAAGMTFGIGTATGAAVGGMLGALRSHGRAIRQRLHNIQEVATSDALLIHLALRQLMLLTHLMQRGHADPSAIMNAYATNQADAAGTAAPSRSSTSSAASSPATLRTIDQPAARAIINLLRQARDRPEFNTGTVRASASASTSTSDRAREAAPEPDHRRAQLQARLIEHLRIAVDDLEAALLKPAG